MHSTRGRGSASRADLTSTGCSNGGPSLMGSSVRCRSLTPLTFANVLHWSMMQPRVVGTGGGHHRAGRFVQADPTDRWSRLAWAGSLGGSAGSTRRGGRSRRCRGRLRARAIRADGAGPGRRHDRRSAAGRGPPGHAGPARLRGRLCGACATAPWPWPLHRGRRRRAGESRRGGGLGSVELLG